MLYQILMFVLPVINFLDYYVVERLSRFVKPLNHIKVFLYVLYLWDATKRGTLEEETLKKLRSTQKKAWSDDKLIENLTPPKNIYFRIYHFISTTTHTILITWTVIMFSLSEESTWRHWLYCHLPRFVFHEALDQKYMILFACLFSSIAVSWRAWTYFDFNLKIHSLSFMMLDPQMIENNSNTEVAAKNYLQRELTLVQSIVLYRIEDRVNHRVLFRRRPNRTPEGRAMLDKLAQWGIVGVAFSVSVGAILLLPICARTVIFQQDVLYPGCETSEHLYLYRLLASSFTTVIFYFDNAFSVIFPTCLIVFIIFDLLLHWRVVELKMDRLSRLLVDLRFRNELYKVDAIIKLNSIAPVMEQDEEKMTRSKNQRLKVDLSPRDLMLMLLEKEEVQKEVYELQSMMGDFFIQLGEADKLISRFLLFGAMGWLGINAFISATGLQTDKSGIIRAFQLSGVLTLTVVSSLAFWLKQNTEPAYKRINHLMAMDMSLDKLRWKVLLKYYTVNARYGFTLISSILYSQLVYAKIITYTFSFFTIVNNFKDMAQAKIQVTELA